MTLRLCPGTPKLGSVVRQLIITSPAAREVSFTPVTGPVS
jgi:hypothetical protein